MEQQIIEVKPIDTTDAQKAEISSNRMLADAKDFVITNNTMYVSAAEFVKGIKGAIKDLDEKRKSITRPIDIAKKAAMDLFRTPLARLAEAEKLLKSGMITYDQEQDKIRLAEEKRLQDLAGGTGGILSPRFVEWMMGFPRMWTELAPSETPSSPGSPNS